MEVERGSSRPAFRSAAATGLESCFADGGDGEANEDGDRPDDGGDPVGYGLSRPAGPAASTSYRPAGPAARASYRPAGPAAGASYRSS